MATTPEGKVKARVKKALEALKARGFPVYYHMPVQNGMGKPTLDFICCINGTYVGIETKAPGKTPTERQMETMREINAAGGTTIVYDGSKPKELVACLAMLL